MHPKANAGCMPALRNDLSISDHPQTSVKYAAIVLAVAAFGLYLQADSNRREKEEAAASAVRKAQEADAKRLDALTPAQRAAEEAAADSARMDMAVRGACMLAIQKTLHDPSSAQFDPSSFVERIDANRWRVQRHLRATNGFGALRYTVIECQVLRNPGDTLTVLSTHKIR